MKLFLASSIDKTATLLTPLLSKEPKLTRLLFVANAADPYTEKWWIDLDRDKFIELGFQLTEIDLRRVSAEEFLKMLNESDELHICGGSVYYLINLIRENNLDKIIINAVKSEKIIYTGTSAGSIIVSRSIAAFSYDEEEKEHIQKVPDKLGLGLIDFTLVPHCNNVDFINEHKKIIEHITKDTDPLIFLQDSQAVLFEGESFKIVSI